MITPPNKPKTDISKMTDAEFIDIVSESIGDETLDQQIDDQDWKFKHGMADEPSPYPEKPAKPDHIDQVMAANEQRYDADLKQANEKWAAENFKAIHDMLHSIAEGHHSSVISARARELLKDCPQEVEETRDSTD